LLYILTTFSRGQFLIVDINWTTAFLGDTNLSAILIYCCSHETCWHVRTTCKVQVPGKTLRGKTADKFELSAVQEWIYSIQSIQGKQCHVYNLQKYETLNNLKEQGERSTSHSKVQLDMCLMRLDTNTFCSTDLSLHATIPVTFL